MSLEVPGVTRPGPRARRETIVKLESATSLKSSVEHRHGTGVWDSRTPSLSQTRHCMVAEMALVVAAMPVPNAEEPNLA